MKTPIIFDVETLLVTSGHWEKFRDNMFFVQQDPGGRAPVRAEADELPGALPPLRRALGAATATSRSGSPRRDAASQRTFAGTLHGLLRVRHVTQDDAHIFCCARPDRGRGLPLPRPCLLSLRPPRPDHARRAARSGPTTSWARTRTGTSPRRRSATPWPPGSRLRRDARRGRVLRPEDRHPHGRTPRPPLAARDRPARLPDASAIRPHLPGADNEQRTPA